MLIRALSRSKIPNFSSVIILLPSLTTKQPIINQTQLPVSKVPNIQSFLVPGLWQYHDGRPRGPLWRGKTLIGKEALFVILGLKRFKDDDEKLDKFIKTNVFRLLKLDMIVVLSELERQEEVSLTVKIFRVIQKQDWYNSNVFLYKDLIMALLNWKNGRGDEVMGSYEKRGFVPGFSNESNFYYRLRLCLEDVD